MITDHTEIRDIAEKHARRIFKELCEGHDDIGLSTPENDRGEWAPNSLLVVYCELGCIPDQFNSGLFKSWDKLEKEISAEVGYPVYFESINAAVSALYEC